MPNPEVPFPEVSRMVRIREENETNQSLRERVNVERAALQEEHRRARQAEKQLKYDHLYMSIAKRCAEMSYARRLKVGCVAVSNGRIISMGWNGMPAGMDNCCETVDDYSSLAPSLVTKPEVQHAEENAILKIAKCNDSALGASMYVTHAPCLGCAKMIYGAGFTRLVYEGLYRYTDGLDFLSKVMDKDSIVKL
jgi:dCMP deaminase